MKSWSYYVSGLFLCSCVIYNTHVLVTGKVIGIPFKRGLAKRQETYSSFLDRRSSEQNECDVVLTNESRWKALWHGQTLWLFSAVSAKFKLAVDPEDLILCALQTLSDLCGAQDWQGTRGGIVNLSCPFLQVLLTPHRLKICLIRH